MKKCIYRSRNNSASLRTTENKGTDLPWITWELSFRKKLYKYLGIKADMQAYARAERIRKKDATTKVET